VKNTIPDLIIIGIFLIPVGVLFYYGTKEIYKTYLIKKNNKKFIEDRVSTVESKINEMIDAINLLKESLDFTQQSINQCRELYKENRHISQDNVAEITSVKDKVAILTEATEIIINDLNQVKEDTKFIMEVA
jgi:septation ring formation regulator EzrA